MAEIDTDSVPKGEGGGQTDNAPMPGEPVHENAKPYQELIDEATKCFDVWQHKQDNIDKLYGDLEALAKEGDRQFQIFWANMEVVKPSIYARPPVPVCVPAFKDRDPVARKAAEMVERAEISSFRQEDIDSVLKLVRDDLAINARGVMRLRYDATETAAGKIVEKVRYDHINRKDFLHDPARNWREVEWVAFGSWLTKKRGVKRFGEIFLQAEFKQKSTKEDGYSKKDKARVWEMWHKPSGMVIWLSPNVDMTLDMKKAWLDLEGFFPCPRPVYGTLQRDSLISIPDFLYIKDQVEEINELTARISALSEGLRLKGFYAAGAEDISDAIERVLNDQDNRATMIPIANMGSLGGQGLKDAIVWLPVDMVATVVKELLLLRREIIDDIYQITGLSDIMRGASDPNETLGAQELKSQYGSVRIRDKQDEMIRIARDAARIAGEIMAENFDPQTMVDMSQMKELPTEEAITQQVQQIKQAALAEAQQALQSPEVQEMVATPEGKQQLEGLVQQKTQEVEGQIAELQQEVTLDKVMALLQEQRLRPFILDIETDSTIQPDENAAKERATEFLTAMGGFMQTAMPLAMEDPRAGPMVAGLMKYTASQYRAGRDVMGMIEDYADQIEQGAGQEGPSPEEQAAQQEMEMRGQEAEAKLSEAQAKLQEIQLRAQAQQQAAEQATEKHGLEIERMGVDAETAGAKAEVEIRKIEADIERINAEIERIQVQTQTTQDSAKREDRRKDAEHNKTLVDEEVGEDEGVGLSEALKSIAQANASQTEVLGEMLKRLTAPRRIVRDETGTAQGVEFLTE